jgi:hypothetical protein
LAIAGADVQGVTPNALRPPTGGPTPASMATLGLTESSEGRFRALTERAPVGIFVGIEVTEGVLIDETGRKVGDNLGSPQRSAA